MIIDELTYVKNSLNIVWNNLIPNLKTKTILLNYSFLFFAPFLLYGIATGDLMFYVVIATGTAAEGLLDGATTGFTDGFVFEGWTLGWAVEVELVVPLDFNWRFASWLGGFELVLEDFYTNEILVERIWARGSASFSTFY